MAFSCRHSSVTIDPSWLRCGPRRRAAFRDPPGGRGERRCGARSVELSFDIHPGEMLGIDGEMGSGNPTILANR
jgi:hypothetical protein